jgi:hypothetical protein
MIPPNKTPCVECGKPAEMGAHGSGMTLWYCITCAKKIAEELHLPAFAAAARDAERRRGRA